ncbi:MAG: hypothetical protein ACPGII_01825 [Opitutales bacterium]
MKTIQSICLLTYLLFVGCSDQVPSGGGGHHVHTAPHGGELYELGPHGSGFNFELFLNENGNLNLYILDAHAENFVRIKQTQIEILFPDTNRSSLSLEAVEDTATGETVGDTSRFQSPGSIHDLLPIQGIIKEISVGSKTYPKQPISFSGNSKGISDEH